MNIKINGSNSLEQLALQLCRELKAQQNTVFQPQYVVTQTEGMNNWLKIKMAGHLGIVANCRFLKPNDLINQVYYSAGGVNRQTLTPATLQWILFSILGTRDFTDRFGHTAQYYVGDDVKRMALAEKTADLFDQYQIYRPDTIQEWNAGAGNHGWQSYLWAKAKETMGDTMPDKTVIGSYIIESLKKEEVRQQLAGQFRGIHVFGLSILTAYHVQLLYELAKVINVSVYLLNPAPSIYWQEDRSEKQVAIWRQKHGNKKVLVESAGNPLLTSWGNVLQDTFGLFFAADEVINSYNEPGSDEPEPTSLLGKIQNDIFNNSDALTRNAILVEDIEDGSITINSCHTIAREVEVLYNYLVHLVDQKKEVLAPRQIVVMVSDIDIYAPYIKAVFNSVPLKFPFTIADESLGIGDNVFSALRSVLELSEDKFEAEQVLELLESALIKKRFGITDLELIRKAVDAAAIRFGIDGREEDDTTYVSWRNGINRIMYGLCLSGNDEYALGDRIIYPVEVAEGIEGLELIRFCHFAEAVIAIIEERRRARTITAWAEYVEQVIDKLIVASEDNSFEEDYQLLLKNLERLYVLNGVVHEKISFEVFSYSFINSLSMETRSMAFASGGITFCSLIPMRSIPFRVVALLGMDFDKFPRKEVKVSFNLIEQGERRKGDRSVRNNDKHLFLETILSAEKFLYLSYLGQSSKDNTSKPPTALADELIDYIQSGVVDDDIQVKDKLVTSHPLQSFNGRYNTSPGFYSYLFEEEVKNEENISTTQEERMQMNEVEVSAFIAFFKNPLKAYFNRVLGINYRTDEVLLPGSEVFETDALQNWQLKNELLSISHDELETFRQKALARGDLPLSNMSHYAVNTISKDVEEIRTLAGEVMDQNERSELLVELVVDGTLLKGKIGNIYGDKLLLISFSKNECKYLVESHIKYLLLAASGHKTEVNFISADKRALFKIPSNRYSCEQALKILEKLVRIYQEGHREIFLFYPDFHKSPTDLADLTLEKFKVLLEKALDPEKGFSDSYLKKAMEYDYFNGEDKHLRHKINCNLFFGDLAEFYSSYYEHKS